MNYAGWLKRQFFLHFVLIVSAVMILAFSCTTTAAAVPEGYDQAKELYERGHELFIARKYREAIDAYTAVDRFLEENPAYRDFFDHSYRGFSMGDMVRRYEALGNITPSVVHRVLVIYVERTEAPCRGSTISSRFTEELKETERRSREICGRILAVLTGGEIRLEFDELSLDAAFTELEPAGDPSPRTVSHL